ncbi:MAG: Holliday junction branch migration protein RuvA [Patescibacteria group bacterium]
MLAYLAGKVARIQGRQILIKTSFGLGFLVYIWDEKDFITNENVDLYIYEVKREDKTELFGFRDWNERDWMEKLMSVNGVGAKTAASIVYTLGIDGIQKGLRHQDPGVFSEVSGVGPKSAKKIILDLKGVLVDDLNITTSGKSSQVSIQFSEALSNLGYKKGEIVGLISEMKRDKIWSENDLEFLVREGIKRMGKKKNL